MFAASTWAGARKKEGHDMKGLDFMAMSVASMSLTVVNYGNVLAPPRQEPLNELLAMQLQDGAV
jgi:hypothetical protein